MRSGRRNPVLQVQRPGNAHAPIGRAEAAIADAMAAMREKPNPRNAAKLLAAQRRSRS